MDNNISALLKVSVFSSSNLQPKKGRLRTLNANSIPRRVAPHVLPRLLAQELDGTSLIDLYIFIVIVTNTNK